MIDLFLIERREVRYSPFDGTRHSSTSIAMVCLTKAKAIAVLKELALYPPYDNTVQTDYDGELEVTTILGKDCFRAEFTIKETSVDEWID